jgi:tetratricopeptide (TPR) repeat protein
MVSWLPALLAVFAAALAAQDIPPPRPPEPPKPAVKEEKPLEEPQPGVIEQKAPGLRRSRTPTPTAGGKEEVPPEEDTSLATENIQYNPLESQKSLTIGNEYYKVGKYRSAASRYKWATAYDDSNVEAWLKLGQASEKLKDMDEARLAYAKYLEAAPTAKNAAEIRRKLEKLK